MDIFELIRARRSIRSFDPSKPVSDEMLRKILEAGTWAPSAGNTQCWRFFVVRDERIKRRLASEAGHQPFIAEAPVVIVVTADLELIERSYGERGKNTYSLQDTAAAIQNMLLAITALGLGSCWVGAFLEEKAAKILELPPNLRPLAILPVGYPAEKPPAPKRKRLEEVSIYR